MTDDYDRRFQAAYDRLGRLKASHAELLNVAKEALSILSSYQAKKCLSVPKTESALKAAIAKAEAQDVP